MSVILGLDLGGIEPGTHSGSGVTVMDASKPRVIEAVQVNWDEWTLGNMMNYYLTTYDVDLVVFESFSPRWGQKFELDTVYLNGALKATVDPDMLLGVTPSAHKSLIKRDWAKQLVLDTGFKIEQGHKVDSTSLCLYYGITHQNENYLEEYKKWLKSR